MKACYKKLFVMSALFLASGYVHNELKMPTSHNLGHFREIATEVTPAKTSQSISVTTYQTHQKGIFDLWFDSAKLFGKVVNVTKVEISNTDKNLINDYKELTKRFSDLQKKSDTLTDELVKSSEEISKLKEQLADMKEPQSDDVDDNIRQEKIAALEELIAQRTAELETAKEAISKFEETKENLKAISEKLAGLEEENESLKLENEKLVCELKNAQSKVETEEIKRLQDELAKITAELDEYKNSQDDDKDSDKVADNVEDDKDKSEDDDKKDDKDDKDTKVVRSKDDKKDKDDKDENDEVTQAALALVEYINTMKEQMAAQRQQQELMMIKQLINPMAQAYTQPQINSYFGTTDAFNLRNQTYLDMLMELNQQSNVIGSLNQQNNWNYGYKDYYGANAQNYRISEVMPWGTHLNADQAMQTQNYDYSRYGYSWGSQIPTQNFNMGLNTASTSPIMGNYQASQNITNTGDFRLF